MIDLKNHDVKKENSLMMRDLGNLGESFFQAICSDAGLVFNGSKIDRTGWDFIVEDKELESPISLQQLDRSRFISKIQVKSTDGTNSNNRITLSNLLSLATAQMPTFIMFFEFDGESTPQRMFIVHLDQELILKILKKVANLSSKGDQDLLNKRKMVINYKEAQKFTKVDGAEFREYLYKCINRNIDAYIKKKSTFLRESGYGDSSITGSFTVSKEKAEELYRMSMSSGEGVNIEGVTLNVNRFGFDQQSDHGRVIIKQASARLKGVDGTVKICALNSPRQFKFDAIYLSSPFFNEAITSDPRTVVEFNFVKIEFYSISSIKFSLNIDPVKKCDLKAIIEFADLLLCLNSDDAEVRLSNINYKGEIKLPLQLKSKLNEFVGISERIQYFGQLVRKSKFNEALELSFEELELIELDLRQVQELVSAKSVLVQLEVESPLVLPDYKKAYYIQDHSMKIGDKFMFFIIIGDLFLELENDSMRVENLQLSKVWIEEVADSESSKFKRQYVEDIQEINGSNDSIYVIQSGLIGS